MTDCLGLPQRLRQPRLGQPEHPDGVLPVYRPARDGLLHGRGLHRRRPHRLQFARRARQHDDRRRAWNHDTRRGADRGEHLGAHRNHGLLAIRRQHGLEVHARAAGHHRLEDVGDGLLEFGVQHHVAARESGDRRDGDVVGGGAEPAAGDDQVDALGRQESQLGLDVLGAVTADGDVGEFDAEFE